MARAWLRSVPDTFDRAIIAEGGRPPRVAMARRQHADYARRLELAGLGTTLLEGDDRYPDCVFIEDTAVILGDMCVVTRPGAAQRRAEVDAVADALGEVMALARITSPGTLDGGDVMMLGGVVFVGLSRRTNEAGFRQLAAIAAETGFQAVAVSVGRVLHLKSAVLPVGGETIVVTPGTVDEEVFSGFQIVHEDENERDAFTALVLPDRLLTSASAPRTTSTLESMGFPVDPIEISEILAADGGLTCMSLLAV